MAKAAFTEGPEGRAIASLAVPMTIGILIIILFGVIDAFFIAQLGESHLAAVSFTFPVLMVLAQVTMGLGTGVSSVIARAIGKKNTETCNDDVAQRRTFHALLLALLVIGGLCVVGLCTITPLFRAIGASEQHIAMIKPYMQILYVGQIFLCIPMMGNFILRAAGDGTTPAIIMSVAGLVNVILDPLFIFGIGPFPRLEMVGAAIATFAAYVISFILGLYILSKKEQLLRWSTMRLQGIKESWGAFLYVGMPAVATNLIFPISQFWLLKIMSTQGEAAVAAFGAAGRVDSLAIVVFMALGASMTPFMGQNSAAQLYGRMQRGFTIVSRFSLYWGLCMVAFLWILASYVAELFTDSLKAKNIMVSYLRIVPLGYAGLGVAIAFASSMNGVRKPLAAVCMTLLRSLVLLFPLVYMLMHFQGITGMFWAIAISHLCTGLIALALYKRMLGLA